MKCDCTLDQVSKNKGETMRIYRADPNVSFDPTQQLSFIKFNFRYF